MSAKETGGPAFPLPAIEYFDRQLGRHNVLPPVPGMNLRDYFAAAAVMKLSTDWQPESAARLAYQLADAMLAERAKGAAA